MNRTSGSDPQRRRPFRVAHKPMCAVCGHPGALLHASVEDQLFGTPGEWDLARCTQRRCGTVWLDPFPEPEEVVKFYSDYYTHTTPAGGNDEIAALADSRTAPNTRTRRDTGWAALVRMRRRAGLSHLESLQPGRLLDVGTGSGDFLVAAQAHGWHVRGCEFDPSAAATAVERGVHVDEGGIDDVGYADESFDAVTANNVIEHVLDARTMLREAHRVLTPGGKFVSVSPNPSSWLHRKYGPDWRGLEVPRHLFLFTPRTLGRLAREAGFRRVLATSSSGDLEAMESASREIRAQRTGESPAITPVSGPMRRALAVAGLLGSDVGEMTVLICEK